MTNKDTNEKLLQALTETIDSLQLITDMQRWDIENDHYKADDALIDFFDQIAETTDDGRVAYAATRVKELFEDLPKYYA